MQMQTVQPKAWKLIECGGKPEDGNSVALDYMRLNTYMENSIKVNSWDVSQAGLRDALHDVGLLLEMLRIKWGDCCKP